MSAAPGNTPVPPTTTPAPFGVGSHPASGASSGVAERYAEFPAGTVHYYHQAPAPHRAASAAPVVLLHDGGLDNAKLSWQRVFPALADAYHVYAPDLPKQGGSRPWNGRANQRTFEELLRWLLDEWGLREATLVGVGSGGSAAAGFAVRHPNRVRRLVLVDSAGLGTRPPRRLLRSLLIRTPGLGKLGGHTVGWNRTLVRELLRNAVFAGPMGRLEGIVEEVHAEVRRNGTLVTDWQLDAASGTSVAVNHLPGLARLHCPSLVVHGEHDPLVPIAGSRRAAETIAGSTLRIVRGAGHWPHVERPDEFNALLRGFLDSTR